VNWKALLAYMEKSSWFKKNSAIIGAFLLGAIYHAEVETTRANGKRLVKPAGIDEDSPRARIDAAVAAVLAVEAASTVTATAEVPSLW
jgi:hypothetical protein